MGNIYDIMIVEGLINGQAVILMAPTPVKAPNPPGAAYRGRCHQVERETMKRKLNLNCIHGKHLGHDCLECRDDVTPEEKARLEYVRQAFANIASDLSAYDKRGR